MRKGFYLHGVGKHLCDLMDNKKLGVSQLAGMVGDRLGLSPNSICSFIEKAKYDGLYLKTDNGQIMINRLSKLLQVLGVKKNEPKYAPLLRAVKIGCREYEFIYPPSEDMSVKTNRPLTGKSVIKEYPVGRVRIESKDLLDLRGGSVFSDSSF